MDFALFLKLFDGAERFVDWHFGIDAVELPEIEALYFQAAQAHFHLLRQVFRTATGAIDWGLAV